MQVTAAQKRITLLDGFRCIAVVIVLLYHYTYRWTPPASDVNLYPYQDWYGNTFRYAQSAVSFFFLMSGFAISFTLENTTDLSTFWKSRLIRLLPPLLLCTPLTFLAVHYLDTQMQLPDLHQPRNFLPSLTMINPPVFERVFHKEFEWLNSSYWTLWVEIQFYLIASAIYFANRKAYLHSLLITALFISLTSRLLNNICCGANNLHIPPFSAAASNEISYWINSVFNIVRYIPHFATGVVFYALYKEGKPANKTTVLLFGLTFISIFFYAKNEIECIINLLMLLLFYLLVYKPRVLQLINNPVMIRIGMVSYTLYLIHEPIGVLIIDRFGSYLGSFSPLMPWILILLTILFAELSFRTYERYTYRFLRKVLFKK